MLYYLHVYVILSKATLDRVQFYLCPLWLFKFAFNYCKFILVCVRFIMC